MTTSSPAGKPPVLIREARAGDLAAARELVANAGLPLDGLDDADLLVAAAGGRVVGTVALERHGRPGDDAAVLLRSAAVDPAWRGAGVGTALVRAALERAGGARVGLLTETASDYFTRFGFRRVERSELPPVLAASPELRGACPASAQAMVRG